jgi:hypothetical protein
LQIDDVQHLLGRKRREDDDLVDAVQELRPESFSQGLFDLLIALSTLAFRIGPQEAERAALGHEFGAEIGGHDQHRVAKVDHTALAVGQAAVVQDLQQGIPNLRVGLFDLVEQDHPVGPAANGFSELAALFVADVAWRRAEEAGGGVLLTVLAHVHADDGVLIIEEELRQGLGQFGLADAGGAEEDKRADGSPRIFEPGTRPADGVRQGMDGLVLADDPLVEPLFHAEQLLGLGFEHLADGDARPLGHDFGDVVLVDNFVELVFGLPGVPFLLEFGLQPQPLSLHIGGAFVIPL